MLKKITLLALFGWIFYSPPQAFSQSNRHGDINWTDLDPTSGRESDFVVLNSGEKLFGKILRNFDKTFYSEIRFQSAGAVKHYLPADLKGFGLDNGQLFFSRQLPGQTGLSFVQILVSGTLELSEYRGSLFFDDGKSYRKLDAYQRDIERNGQTVRKQYKPFIFILKTALNGDCAVMLYPRVDRLNYHQDQIVRLLEDYYVCQGSEYTVHVERVPMLQLSPTAGIGMPYYSLGNPQKDEGRNDQLVNNSGFQGFAGLRIHDFRIIPRLSMDLRLGYSIFNTTVISSYEAPQFLWTASEDVRETAFYVPVSLNYSVVKNQQSDLYVGVFAGLWAKQVTLSNGIVDERVFGSGETLIWEEAITTVTDSNFISGVKVGYGFSLTEMVRLFGELEVSSQKEYYQFSLFANDSEYARDRFSFQIGLEF
ncbi:hypothetical protein GCM10009119_17610 [Algoriphagus jejuensis]|uniref:Outer membrane protein beta-barrel domain-containing protein n=1 Tax=Algoriphagus jejuensis TaxID=419934 RepID=A0ABP3YCX0_9BACT